MQEALNRQRIDQIELEMSLMEKEGNQNDENDDENMFWRTETHLNILRMNLRIVSNLETENSFKPIVFIQ